MKEVWYLLYDGSSPDQATLLEVLSAHAVRVHDIALATKQTEKTRISLIVDEYHALNQRLRQLGVAVRDGN